MASHRQKRPSQGAGAAEQGRDRRAEKNRRLLERYGAGPEVLKHLSITTEALADIAAEMENHMRRAHPAVIPPEPEGDGARDARRVEEDAEHREQAALHAAHSRAAFVERPNSLNRMEHSLPVLAKRLLEQACNLHCHLDPVMDALGRGTIPAPSAEELGGPAPGIYDVLLQAVAAMMHANAKLASVRGSVCGEEGGRDGAQRKPS